MNFQRKRLWVSLAAAALLAGCGGGGGDSGPLEPVRGIKVVGDSLADSGTFGYKFTVQGTAPTGSGAAALWVDHVAASYGQTLCARYASTDGASFATKAGCTNYAVAGGRINNARAPTSPLSIAQQLRDAGAAGYVASDLLLVDGGGNDAADLIGAYLQVGTDGGASYRALLGTLLDAATVNAAFAGGASGLAQVGGAYMQALALQLAATLKTQALDKGAPRVAVLNIPDILETPRFKLVLASIAAAQGTAASAQATAVFDAWIQAFNTQLNASFAGNSRVAIANFNAQSKDQAARPAQYGLTNITTPACPVTGRGSDGLPTYTFPTCTAAALSAAPPVGVTGGADWWRSYAFADGFHPTPLAHQQLGQLVSRALSQAGWL